jgi:hypothetical protein
MKASGVNSGSERTWSSQMNFARTKELWPFAVIATAAAERSTSFAGRVSKRTDPRRKDESEVIQKAWDKSGMIGTDEILSADGSGVSAANTGKRQRNAIRIDSLSRSASFSLRGHRKSEKDNGRPVEAQYILVVQPADPCADLGF